MKKTILLILIILITPSIIADNETKYSQEYLCKKIDSFIANKTINYESTDIVELQEEIRWEIDLIIPIATLKHYVDSDQFCHNETIKNTTSPPKTQSFNEILGMGKGIYLQIPLNPINIGQYKIHKDSNAKGFFDFVNIFFPLDISDEYSENPNIVWGWKFRIVPILALIVVIAGIDYIRRRVRQTNDNIDDIIRKWHTERFKKENNKNTLKEDLN